jgi:hypothetical protein
MTLPSSNPYATPVIRTDFSDDAAWTEIADTITRPTPEGFGAVVTFLDDRAHRDLTPDELMALVPAGFPRSFLLVIDGSCVREAEHPVLVIDLCREPGRQFRAVPSAVQSVENNLSISNMDFHEFADSTDAGGIFRGF